MATLTMTATDVSAASEVALAAASSSRPLKGRPSPLPTPQSATFPSALQSPLPSAGRLHSATFLRAEKTLKTPLTPPSAYFDFLKSVDKAKSPLKSTTSLSFPALAEPRSPYPWPKQPASARPALSTLTPVTESKPDVAVGATLPGTTSVSAPAIPTLSKPLARRASDGARTEPPVLRASTSDLPTRARPQQPIRRPSLMIPESPSIRSPSLMTPASAARALSPSSASATAAKNYYMGLTPLSAQNDAPTSAGGTRPVTVRHVVTRTVTYKRPLNTPTSARALSATSPYPGQLPVRSSAPPSRTASASGDDDPTSARKMDLSFVLDQPSDSTTYSSYSGSSTSGSYRSSPHRRAHSHSQTRSAPHSRPQSTSTNHSSQALENHDTIDTDADAEDSQNRIATTIVVSPPGHFPSISRPLIGDAPKGKRRKVEME